MPALRNFSEAVMNLRFASREVDSVTSRYSPPLRQAQGRRVTLRRPPPLSKGLPDLCFPA